MTTDRLSALLVVVDLETLLDFAALAVRFARGDAPTIDDAALISLLAAARDRAARRTDAEEPMRPRPPIPGFPRKED